MGGQALELPAIAALQPDAHERLAVGQYATENLESKARSMAAGARPRSLASFVRWLRYAYRQEPPFRLHSRETGADGNPKMTGDFFAWIRSAEEVDLACGVDAEGYFRWPLRCAMVTLHGRSEDSDDAEAAHFLTAVAQSDENLWVVADRVGLRPAWVVRPAAEYALARLWDLAAPMRALR